MRSLPVMYLNVFHLLLYQSSMRFVYDNIDDNYTLFAQLIRIQMYRQNSNISRTFVGNIIVDHSDVVGASPVGAAPTASSFST